ncbi:hypothetical protein [Clostridium tyrobutyricum]|jgi:hypothetical protein|uniref:hypothetical protein n=1 Tax=Clostridium tyrobutyricum TaxID=1519 RepID=UPI00242B7BB8|nr:hypothetical protein [Clostridium tyrobutyricum]MCH4200546.1 hypothetical protein [Clostridium tyrobutyricum]
MKIKDTFLTIFLVWVLAADGNDKLKYLVLAVFAVWIALKIIKFKILKSKKLER